MEGRGGDQRAQQIVGGVGDVAGGDGGRGASGDVDDRVRGLGSAREPIHGEHTRYAATGAAPRTRQSRQFSLDRQRNLARVVTATKSTRLRGSASSTELEIYRLRTVVL